MPLWSESAEPLWGLADYEGEAPDMEVKEFDPEFPIRDTMTLTDELVQPLPGNGSQPFAIRPSQRIFRPPRPRGLSLCLYGNSALLQEIGRAHV